jgi:hypothetical protein
LIIHVGDGRVRTVLLNLFSKKEYDELLAVYSKKRSECEHLDRQLPIIKVDIDELKNKLAEFVLPQGESANDEQLEGEKQQLIKKYEELTSLLNRVELEHAEHQDREILELTAELNNLESTLSSFTFVENTGELHSHSDYLTSLQK